ncbi:hypothetical protein BC830DRAFT_321376 [Chytriomyces sp. MP71]|nr:hypothetical protein BC830DRAFT_321376 [Chytriomyces sp. MP71]
MEEYDVPLHCIFRVVPHLEGAGTGLEVKVMERAGLTDVAPVNRVLAEAREWCDSAGEDSYWRGVAWNVIKLPATLGSGQTGASPPTNAAAATAPPGIAGAPNSSPGGTAGSSVPGGLDGKEIFDAIALRIYSQLRMRRDFKTVYSDEKVVLIPGITDVNIVKTQMRSLGGLLDLMPYSVFLNSEILLGTVVEQSMRALKAEEDVDAMNGMDPVPLTLIDDMGPLVSYFEKSLKKLSLGVGKSMGIGASGMVGFGTTPPEPSKL